MNSLPTSIRLGVLALLVPLSGFLFSCENELTIKKDPNAVSVAGDYQFTGVTSYTINGAVSTTPTSGTLSVFQGDSPDTYYFLEKIKGRNPLGYEATRTGDRFTVEPVYDFSTYKNVNYYGQQKGGGAFKLGKIELNRVAKTDLVAMSTPSGEVVAYRMPIQKQVTFVANK